MMTINPENGLNQLKQIVQCCDEIEKLLAQDKALFTRNDLQGINENQPKKQDVIQKLSVIIDQIQSQTKYHPETAYFKQLATILDSAAPALCIQYQNLMNQLDQTLRRCQQHIAINSKIATANLAYFHKIWQKLSALKNDECVYEIQGNR